MYYPYPTLPTKVSFLLLFLFASITLSSQIEISGKVVNEEQEGLSFANVIIDGTYEGTATDVDGNFVLSTSNNPANLLISYIGYKTKRLTFTASESDVVIILEEGLDLSGDIVVSASRKREMVQEAPAAVSILGERKLRLDASAEPMLALRNLVGVDIAQYGVGTGQINLRGKSEVFQTETFVIADHRNIVIPSLGTFFAGQHPIDLLDLERIEVIKGPGSALYGPGVEGGIVHFISKDPFRHPGTSVSIAGGTQEQFIASFRHAQVLSDKLAFKITGHYRRANDFELDPDDPVHAERMAGYISPITSQITGEVIEDAMVPNYFTRSLGITGNLAFKINEKTTLNAIAGFGEYKGLFRTSQGESYVKTPRPFAQLRLNSERLFAQAFWSRSPGKDGNSYLFSTGQTTFNSSSQFEGQVQYNFDMMDDKLNITVGSDARFITIDTKGTINGRFEDEDDYSILGAYVQGKYQISDKLDLIGTARVDRFSILDATAFSPRLGLVYKHNAAHTFRATWNRAFGAPTSLNLFADTPIANTGTFQIYLLNGTENITFNENNGFNFITGSYTPGGGMPLATLHAIGTGALEASLPPDLVGYLFSLIPQMTGFSNAIPTSAPVTRAPLSLSQSNMFEIGYKGVIANKWAVTLDVYYNKRKNILSAPLAVSPFLLYPTAAQDHAAALAELADPNVLAAFGQSAESLSAIYSQIIEGITKDDEGNLSTLGILSSDNSPTENGTWDFAYLNFEELDYFGIDFGLEYYVNNALSVFGNVSWINQVLWEDLSLVESEISRPLSLNMPGTRIKAGINYTPESGFFGNISARMTSDWESVNGLSFSGPVDGFTIVDLGLGYKFNQNIQVSVNTTNLFNTKYRAIYGAPDIRRMVLGRIIYDIR